MDESLDSMGDHGYCLSNMTNDEGLLEKVDMQEIADKGSQIYESIKGQYEPQDHGKFLAIDIKSGKAYLGQESSEAIGLARLAHPDTVFFVVKIGYSASEILAGMGLYAERSH